MTAITAGAAPARPKLSPRKRAQRVRIVQYVVLAAAVLAVILTADGPQLQRVFMRPDLVLRTFTSGLPLALGNTIAYTAGAFVVGLTIGTLLALMRLSQVAPYRWISTVYVEFFRGVPALIVLLAFGGLSIAFPGMRVPLEPYGTVWIALGMVSAAYMSETIRAGIQAVPKGQIEAARSLGMPTGMATRKIVLPQAFRIVIPPLTNELILLTKDSSLVFAIGLASNGFELTKFGRDLMNSTANMTPLIVAGLCYLIITLPLTVLVRRMENKARKATR
ncbi:amino acid ABC transporter permease [Propioniciclava tarda]|uniref:Amino acid ABC transporter permease n=1 Tax=Propioniciclava tarda TaxID=433330 RepID=A0A4Q9KL21_PROTD|nr:amino acid ABC transporter permease [Propioniciclava tarda]TBT95206.1 amino acid ABC transporter permease [Propioniciclava tarda]SMO52104.1 amino acid ABC transporter membrane protein, PAAT family [Propioniciclava tarda]HQA32155.1 amino acid ABC transporter permease [Propioniciclava tarda]HQD60831.1 amino acid ABC transporter permease [Propioniciclava tarda]